MNIVKLAARTYMVGRHDNDNEDLIPCKRCNGEPERVIDAPEGQGYPIQHTDGFHERGWLVECAACKGSGGDEKPAFSDLMWIAFAGDLQGCTLSIDNYYYVTVYVNPGRTLGQEAKAINAAWHTYDALGDS